MKIIETNFFSKIPDVGILTLDDIMKEQISSDFIFSIPRVRLILSN